MSVPCNNMSNRGSGKLPKNITANFGHIYPRLNGYKVILVVIGVIYKEKNTSTKIKYEISIGPTQTAWQCVTGQ